MRQSVSTAWRLCCNASGVALKASLLGSGMLKIATSKDPLRAMDQVAVLNTPLAPPNIPEPTFVSKNYDVKDFGAVGDDKQRIMVWAGARPCSGAFHGECARSRAQSPAASASRAR